MPLILISINKFVQTDVKITVILILKLYLTIFSISFQNLKFGTQFIIIIILSSFFDVVA